jgi:hypothetical protein
LNCLPSCLFFIKLSKTNSFILNKRKCAMNSPFNILDSMCVKMCTWQTSMYVILCTHWKKYNEIKNSKIKGDNLNSHTFENEFTLTKLEHKKRKFLSSLTQNGLTYKCTKNSN